MNNISAILSQFENYKEKTLKNRLFKHHDIENLIRTLSTSDLFEIEKAGESFESRPLYLLKMGKGSTKVFLWSQMHGDEPTATMTLFDLFNFFKQTDAFDSFRRSVVTNCTLYFLPMVNPDGAEKFIRRNAQGIDINRDYHSQQTPEARILKALRDKINPEFGFNLHDMSPVWSAGNTGYPATISFLAPAYDEKKSINDVRLRAIQIIIEMHREIAGLIPNHIGRWNDEYEPRAFGDNFQKAGTSTILIESGGYPDDWEKQFNRKLVFGALLSGLGQIASESYLDKAPDDYFLIPENSKRHYSHILRNCKIYQDNKSYYIIDIGLVAEETFTNGQLETLYKMEDMGDLTGFYGYEEFDLTGAELVLRTRFTPGNPADLTATKYGETILLYENGKIITKKSKLTP